MGMIEQHAAEARSTRGGVSREELRGRAVGIAVLACFGLAWVSWGVSTGLPAAVELVLTVVGVLASVAAIASAVFIFRNSAAVPSGAEALRERPVGRRFGMIVAAEFIGIYVIARVLAAVDHTELIPMIVCLGVGIHFFPLSRLFSVPLYDRTGAALCLVTLATAVLAPLTGEPALWTMLPGLGAALVLYTTCTVLFRAVIKMRPPIA